MSYHLYSKSLPPPYFCFTSQPHRSSPVLRDFAFLPPSLCFSHAHLCLEKLQEGGGCWEHLNHSVKTSSFIRRFPLHSTSATHKPHLGPYHYPKTLHLYDLGFQISVPFHLPTSLPLILISPVLHPHHRQFLDSPYCPTPS